ncbi:MAG: hypothetical protein IH628_05465, partial [Proteobacteria bacterium]|nr:hypothetical protein [Pseudomonadota bacterium]
MQKTRKKRGAIFIVAALTAITIFCQTALALESPLVKTEKDTYLLDEKIKVIFSDPH